MVCLLSVLVRARRVQTDQSDSEHGHIDVARSRRTRSKKTERIRERDRRLLILRVAFDDGRFRGAGVSDQTAIPGQTSKPSAERIELGARIVSERRRASALGDIREAIFGAQDGLVSTLAVVSTVSGATSESYPVLVAGIATALAGMFSMAAGEYLSSKSQREIALATIADEREKVARHRTEVQSELSFMLEEDGLPVDEAEGVAAIFARHPEVLLATKAQKEFGVAIEEAAGSPLQGAIVMGIAFGLGALAPVLPYLLLPVGTAVYVSLLATGAVLLGIGIAKTRWTRGNPLASGIEILAIGAAAGIVGYLFGTILPTLLGAPAVGG
jgi:VIT1/CCC1 family predicted Fe2+/Mn2+ transporter